MKRLTLYLLTCLLCLSACGHSGEEPEGWTARQMARAILDTQKEVSAVTELTDGAEDFAVYLTGCYQMDPAQVEEGAILSAGGVSALEVAVLRLVEDADADAVQRALASYIDSRIGAFTGYAPEQAAILERSGTAVRGRYAALLICPDHQAARDAFSACFEGAQPPAETPGPAAPSAPSGPDTTQQTPAEEPSANASAPAESSAPSEAAQKPPAPAVPPASDQGAAAKDPSIPADSGASVPEPPVPAPAEDPALEPQAPAPAEEPASETPVPAPTEADTPAEDLPWRYDRQRLLEAWASGDWQTGLAERDRVILQTCADLFAELITGEMTDYEKELAIHDWMLDWGSYDPEALSTQPGAQPNPDGDNPYGFLVDRVGICTGYASTFQLLMGLAGIECITVRGSSHGGTRDHAWNMVRLDGEWYCVDVTWDDPITSDPVPASASHLYFNVTSDFLRMTDHQWDETQSPRADSSAQRWQP